MTTGERRIQREMRSTARADRFYERQLLESLNPRMIDLVQRQEMVFVATADAAGNCDSSPRFGQVGFVKVIDTTTLAIPEYRGNGVFASLGNILDNPHVGLLFLDFADTTVGLHVNGKAHSYANDDLPEPVAERILADSSERSRILERWIVVTVNEAYIHCSKHVPRLQNVGKPIDWGTDDPVAKSNDYFIESDSTDRDSGSPPER